MKNHRSQAGLSLIELMIGLTIGLVISLGLFTLIANSSRAFKVQDDFSRLLDNGTSALRYLVDDVRMAGFYGLAASAGSVDYAIGGIGAITDDCGAALAGPARPWALDMGIPIQVNNTLTPASVNAAFPCIQANDFEPGSPVIVLRGALGFRVPDANGDGNLAADIAAQPNSAATLYVQSSPNQDPNTLVFPGAGYAAIRSAGNHRALAAGADAPIFEYQAHVYYVRRCSRPTPPATVCAAAGNDDGGRSIPTLVRHELVGGAMQAAPLAEGIERMVLTYGIDADADGIVDRFTATPADWTQVVAVRVALLARTATTAPGAADAAKTYDLGDGVPVTCTAGVNCDFKRHVFSHVVGIRNCGFRRGVSGSC